MAEYRDNEKTRAEFYTIHIKLGEVADPYASVWIQLVGEEGVSGQIQIKPGYGPNDKFEKGRIYKVVAIEADIGRIMDVKFGHDVASAPSKGLYVQEVVVTASRKDGAAFPCHCWTGNEDKVTVKHVNGYGVTPAHPHIKKNNHKPKPGEMALETRTPQKLDVNHLVQAASNVLDFLEEVDKYPGLYAGSILMNAIRRYELFWLPLAAKQGKKSRLLAAPLDIAWVWHVHMLAPDNYEQDCLNIVSQVIDHTPMNRYQRQEGLQRARHLWETTFPGEPFEVDLTKPTPFVIPGKLKIQHDLEKACNHHSKFYYQVSLPHYTDRKFLAKAVERYEHHLKLKSRNPLIPMVPCYDVDLIRRSHKQLPLNYKRVTTEMFGAMVQRDDIEASTMDSTLDYLEKSTRAAWQAAGLQFEKPGAMYRGEPPPHRPPRPDKHYASLALLEYVLSIQRVQVLKADSIKTFYVRLFDPEGNLILLQGMKGGFGVELMNQCIVNNEKKHAITVSLYEKAFYGQKVIGSCQTSLMSYIDSLYVGGPAPTHPWIIDVPFIGSQSIVRLTVMLNLPTVEEYRFTIHKNVVLTEFDHPSNILHFPQAMLTPGDLAKRFLPCQVATHTLLDVQERDAFKCRVVHCTVASLAAVEVFSLDEVILASANTVNSTVLPEKESVDGEERCVPLNLTEGERAILIRGQKDWGICIGKLQKGNLFKRTADQVEITFFSLHGKKGWCEVIKYKEGLYQINLDSSNYVYVDSKKSICNVSPALQNIPEAIALAFSVTILYRLCKPAVAVVEPHTSIPMKRSSPSSHKKAEGDKTPPMPTAGGYRNTSVPTDRHLGHEVTR
ncbi:uncharacterized protein LOC144650308 [Oculina patagonica]